MNSREIIWETGSSISSNDGVVEVGVTMDKILMLVLVIHYLQRGWAGKRIDNFHESPSSESEVT